MFRIAWKSGSAKSGKWAVGIVDKANFEVAVVRGKTLAEAQTRARLFLGVLKSAKQ